MGLGRQASETPAETGESGDGLLAREQGLAALRRILDGRTPLDDALADLRRTTDLSARDRAFARALVAVTLRRLGQIDTLIDRCLAKPLPAAGAVAQHILRLGATQLLFLDTPAHAAVNTTVNLAARRAPPYRALTNAVMRRLTREGPALVAMQDAERLNTPDWLWYRWSAAWGEVTVRKIAAAHLLEAPLDITVRGDASEWAHRLDATVLPSGSLRRPAGGAIETLAGHDDGAWWIQDAAAALPVRLFGDVTGKRTADLCAAPGGKTAQLAAAGAVVTAVDRSAPRLEQTARNLARLKLTATLVQADAATWQPDERFDGVLLDAPCSATGTIRRHPDIPRLKAASDVTKLAGLQKRMLARAAALLKPGSTLVYCTCSLQPEEGELQAAAVPLRPVPVDAAELGVPQDCITPEGWLRTLPHHWGDWGGMDGFFAARWVKD
jgi:16S rRNA (cytosine967-C5)-methyltransferase